MIRKLMASSAMLALMSAGAITLAQAQSDPAQPVIVEQEAAAAPVTELAASEQVLMPTQPTLATIYIGRSVYSSTDPESDNIGDVNDLIVSEDGTITHAVIGVGGFLGMGEKDVAVPFDELQVVEEEGDIRLIYSSTREQLEAAPALDRDAFDPTAVAATDVAPDMSAPDALAPAPLDQAAAPADDATAPADDQMAAAPEPAAPADDATAPADDQMAAAPADEATAPADDQMAVAPEASDDAAAPADDQTAASDEAAIEDQPEEQASVETGIAPEAEEATQERPATDQAAADLEAAPAEQATTEAPAADEDLVAADAETLPATGAASEGFLTFSADQIRASDLIGQAVYSGEDSIGEVSDIILNDDGETRVAIIDVGGFLGVGEKPVALPFEELQISENAEDGVTQVTVAMSREQLEQLPAYESPETAAVDMAPATDGGALPAQPSDLTAEAPTAGETDDIVTGSVETAPSYDLATQDLSAEELIGATVYGQDESNVGEISDVIFDKAGTIQAVVVDVGGFLGMGEKPVAVGFDSLNVRTDDSGNLLAMVNSTKDQLDQAPAYEEPAPATDGAALQ